MWPLRWRFLIRPVCISRIIVNSCLGGRFWILVQPIVLRNWSVHSYLVLLEVALSAASKCTLFTLPFIINYKLRFPYWFSKQSLFMTRMYPLTIKISIVTIGIWKTWIVMGRFRRLLDGLRRIHMCHIWPFKIQEHKWPSCGFIHINEKIGTDNINTSKNFDMALFPPCRSTLIQQLKRLNYKTEICRRPLFQKLAISHPCNEYGWRRLNWTCMDGGGGDNLPTTLPDISEKIVGDPESDCESEN